MKLRPVERRIAAWLLALVVLVLAYFLLLHWWFVAPQQAMDAQIRQLRGEQHRYAAIVAQRHSLAARLERLQQGQIRSNALLPENDPSTASADLMQHVVDVVSAQSALGPCAVTQKMPVQASPAQGPYPKVTVNINLRCGMHALAAVLYALEQGTPYLFIDNFSIYRNPVRGRDGSMQPLQVQLSLSGYLRPSGGKAEASKP